jgi:hypothetical protein
VLEQLELTQIWAEIHNATKIGAFLNFTPCFFFCFYHACPMLHDPPHLLPKHEVYALNFVDFINISNVKILHCNEDLIVQIFK